jgi:UDP-glucose 4-epimerase
VSRIDDYTSHSTERLTVDEVKRTLLSLDIVRRALPA